jgi:hypothetical protein
MNEDTVLIDLGDAKVETRQVAPGAKPDELVGIGRKSAG